MSTREEYLSQGPGQSDRDQSVSHVRLDASGVADGSGKVVITFPAVPGGQVYSGSVGVPDSDTGGVWESTVGGALWGGWTGPTPITVQLLPSLVLVLTGTGLTSGKTYHGVFIGATVPPGKEQNWFPLASRTAVASGGGPDADPFEMFWPLVITEDFPTTFNEGSYSTYQGRPCGNINGGPQGVPGIAWSNCPRTSPRDTSGTLLTIDVEIACKTVFGLISPSSCQFVWGNPTLGATGPPPGIRLIYRIPGIFPTQIDTETCDNTAGAAELHTNVAQINDQNWHRWSIVVSAAKTTFSLDGSLVSTHTTRLWPDNIGDQLQPQFNVVPNVGGGTFPDVNVTAVRFRYNF